jgi:Zn-finger nucleic acid-binding protein
VRYIPCPTCTKLMNRTNFAQASGVILDVCKQHGVWLDRGELQRVMGFVDAGGMAVSREREKEKLAEEQRRLLALQSAPAAGTNIGSFVVTTRTSTWSGTNDNMGRSIEHVLNDLLNLGFAK